MPEHSVHIAGRICRRSQFQSMAGEQVKFCRGKTSPVSKTSENQPHTILAAGFQLVGLRCSTYIGRKSKTETEGGSRSGNYMRASKYCFCLKSARAQSSAISQKRGHHTTISQSEDTSVLDVCLGVAWHSHVSGGRDTASISAGSTATSAHLFQRAA